MSKRDESVLVLGGTGNYGRYIVKSLLDKNERVRVLSRDSRRAREILSEKPELIEGDITSRESVIEALRGVKAIIISVSAFSRKTIRKIAHIEPDSVMMVLDEARKSYINRIVYISVYDILKSEIEQSGILQGKIKQEIEKSLNKSDFNWTVLGAPPMMDIFFAFIRGGSKMMVPGGDPPKIVTISPADLGEIAAQAVLRNNLAGKRFRMAGPEAFSFPEAADRITKITGKKISFIKIPLLPLRIASILSRPINPYLSHLFRFVKLLNSSSWEKFATELTKDHQLLRETFDYQPTTLELQAKLWITKKE